MQSFVRMRPVFLSFLVAALISPATVVQPYRPVARARTVVGSWMQRVLFMLLCTGCGPILIAPKASADDRSEFLEIDRRARELYDNSRYEPAIALVPRLLQLSDQHSGASPPATAGVPANLALRHRATGQYQESLVIAKKAHRVSFETYGDRHRATASTLVDMALAHQVLGDYPAAVTALMHAREIYVTLLGEGDPAVAKVHVYLARLFQAQGRYEESNASFESALKAYRELAVQYRPMLADTLVQFAGLYRVQGAYSRAHDMLREAAAMHEAVLGERGMFEVSPEQVELLLAKGEVSEAVTVAQQSLEQARRLLPSDHPIMSVLLWSYASSLLAVGKPDLARENLQHALAVQEATLGRNHPEVAGTLMSLASFHARKRRYRTASWLLKRSIAIRTASFGADHIMVALALKELACILRLQGSLREAKRHFVRVREIIGQRLGQDHPAYADVLHQLSELSRITGDVEQGIHWEHAALAVEVKALGPSHPVVVSTLANLAWLHLDDGDLETGILRLEESETALENHIQASGIADSEQGRRLLMELFAEDIDGAVRMALHTRHPRAERLALTKLLRRKDGAMGTTAGNFRALRELSSLEVRQLLDEYQDNRSRYAIQSLRGPEGFSVEQYRRNLRRLDQDAQELKQKIRLRGLAATPSERQRVTIESLQLHMPPDSVLVEFVRFRAKVSDDEEHYAAVALTRGDDPVWVDLGSAEKIDRLIYDLHGAMSNRLESSRELSRTLRLAVFAPIEKALDPGCGKVWISPAGALSLVPFSALPGADEKYLIEKYLFTYLTSGREIMRYAVKNDVTPNAPVIIADPDHGSTGTFSRVPGIAQVAAAIRKWYPSVHLESGSAPTAVRIKSVRRPWFIHIASHGCIMPPAACSNSHSKGHNPLTTGMALAAGAHRCGPGREDDGFLAALEFASLDLAGTKLAVLSACDTELEQPGSRGNPGRVAGLDEGVHGLRRALVWAGAETQVITLWSVDDRSTSRIMARYYELLAQGRGRSAALREAKLSTLRHVDSTSPYYWAGFIVSGNPDPMTGSAGVVQVDGGSVLQAPSVATMAGSVTVAAEKICKIKDISSVRGSELDGMVRVRVRRGLLFPGGDDVWVSDRDAGFEEPVLSVGGHVVRKDVGAYWRVEAHPSRPDVDEGHIAASHGWFFLVGNPGVMVRTGIGFRSLESPLYAAFKADVGGIAYHDVGRFMVGLGTQLWFGGEETQAEVALIVQGSLAPLNGLILLRIMNELAEGDDSSQKYTATLKLPFAVLSAVGPIDDPTSGTISLMLDVSASFGRRADPHAGTLREYFFDL